MNNRILVAGAAGAIGRPLCRLLAADGWRVSGTTRTREKADTLEESGIIPIIVDVFDAERLHEVLHEVRPGCVIHQLSDLPPGLAPARMPEAVVRNARLREIGTRNLVAAAVAAGVNRMIAQSIAFAYAPGVPPLHEDAPLHFEDPALGVTARAVAGLERQVLAAPFAGIVLRYGRLYGPGTGVAAPPAATPLHVDAAADAARRAVTRGESGVYNIAEADGSVSIEKAVQQLGWRPDFRADGAGRSGY